MTAPAVEIRNQLKSWAVPPSALEKLLRWQMARLGYAGHGLSLLLCGDQASRSLNRRFRNKDKATDILSFPSFDAAPPTRPLTLLGDLALNLPYSWKRRGRFHADFRQETAFLLVHGLAHLLGRHHDTMKAETDMHRFCGRAWPAPKALAAAIRFKRTR